MKLLTLIIFFCFSAAAENDSAFEQASKALLNKDIESFSLLLNSGVVNTHSTDQRGNTLLHKAVLYDDPRAVEILLEFGADPVIFNRAGDTAKELAENMGNIHIIRLILLAYQEKYGERQILLPIENIQKELWQAVKEDTYRRVFRILKAGGKTYINTVNEQGGTLLTQAIERLNQLNHELSKSSGFNTDWRLHVRKQQAAMQSRKDTLAIINILLAYKADRYIGRPQNAVSLMFHYKLDEIIPIFAKHKVDMNVDQKSDSLTLKGEPNESNACRQSF